uniref:olfactory receptor 13C7-like n=1 Tax=Myodes glareolus TaxID=447135 RepID=UPI0020225292|nr:olfactory receptor 13C7-like [Myodes glareolus]
MESNNQTSPVTRFILLGLSAHPKLEKTFFLLILLMYLVILLACAVQMFLSFAMGATECVLLSMMAFDRYVAICNPLRYPVIMSKALYMSMAISSWVSGIITATVQTSLAMRLPFCGDNVINHFTCEILAVLKLACADITINVISMGVANVMFLGLPVLFIFVSYVFILVTILRIPSAEGRRKAFSTCSAHLTVVIVFYGTILFMYGKPKSKDPQGADKQDVSDKLISLFYGVLTPMLNPIIYSLRNKDVRAAIQEILQKRKILKRANNMAHQGKGCFLTTGEGILLGSSCAGDPFSGCGS